jgi:hypothetical protein
MDKQISEVVEWLRMLSLPPWVRWLVVGAIVLAVGIGFFLVTAELVLGRKDLAAVGASLLAVSLPLSMVVLLLVFGKGDHDSLSRRTKELLSRTVPDAVQAVLDSPKGSRSVARDSLIETVVRGFVADYAVRITPADSTPGRQRLLELTVELNINKANVVLWLPGETTTDAAAALQTFCAKHRGTLDGARTEYAAGNDPAQQTFGGRHRLGLVFTKQLGDKDFLLKPQTCLYWAQDLAFFVQGFLRSDAFDVPAV